MEITHPSIDTYLERLHPSEDPILAEMEEEGNRRNFPIIGRVVGRLLFQLVRLSNARRILDMGSGFGYSAYWMALALDADAEITLTDFVDENLKQAQEYFRRGSIRCTPHFYAGDCLALLDQLEGEFDFVFNDVEKELYPEVLEKIPQRLRSGGVLVTDNVLWHGKVTEPDPDEATLGVLRYTAGVFEHPNLFSTVIPVRDGVSISLRR